MRTTVAISTLWLLAACGGASVPEEGATDDADGADVAAGWERLAIRPLPAETPLTLRIDVALKAERTIVDADPLGPRSRFVVARGATATCRVVASSPRGIGPDGPTDGQRAILDAAQAASERGDATPDELSDAAGRSTAVTTEPNWQPLLPDVDGAGGNGPCEGRIVVDDKEVYRLGFDGADMGEGVETRKGSGGLENGPSLVVWYDLKGGRLLVDAQMNSFMGRVPSINVGGRADSRNEGFTLNDEWGQSAGERTRLAADGVRRIPGSWRFTSAISPDRHHGFSGQLELKLEVAAR
jgi:hypothetical protein